MVDAVALLAARLLATVPIAAGLIVLLTSPANVAVTVGATVFLLAYLHGWQRVESGAIPLHRMVVPVLLAVGVWGLAMLLALLVSVDHAGLALIVAVAGMAAGFGALALAVRSAPLR